MKNLLLRKFEAFAQKSNNTKCLWLLGIGVILTIWAVAVMEKNGFCLGFVALLIVMPLLWAVLFKDLKYACGAFLVWSMVFWVFAHVSLLFDIYNLSQAIVYWALFVGITLGTQYYLCFKTMRWIDENLYASTEENDDKADCSTRRITLFHFSWIIMLVMVFVGCISTHMATVTQLEKQMLQQKLETSPVVRVLDVKEVVIDGTTHYMIFYTPKNYITVSIKTKNAYQTKVGDDILFYPNNKDTINYIPLRFKNLSCE